MALKGQTVIITGGTGSLGQAVTQRFVRAGARVALTYRNPAEWEALREQLADPEATLSLRCDVTDAAQVEQAFAQVAEQLGPPQALLNLVGGYAAGTPVAEMDEALWDGMLNLNLKSAFLCCREALRHMLPAGYGRIVNVSSKIAVDLPAKAAAAAVAKAGVAALTQCLAQELKGTGVSVAAILPSVIDSPAMRQAAPKANHSRWVPREEIAEMLLWLADRRAGAVNGALIPMFGGL